MEVAARLFQQQGFKATGIQQIIDEAGVAKGTLYSHFKNKDELGVAWLREYHKMLSQGIREVVDTKKTPKSRLLALFDALAVMVDKPETFRGCIFINTLAEVPETTHPLRQQVRANKDFLRQYIRELLAPFDLRPAKLSTTADTIYLLFEGAVIETQNYGEGWPIKVARAAAAQMIDGLE